MNYFSKRQIGRKVASITMIGLLTLTLIFASLTSCDKTVKDTPVPKPTLSGIDPDMGTWNDIVTISGDNFGIDAKIVSVRFQNKEAIVRRVTNTEIDAIVPEEAGTGPITITIGDEVLISPIFTYEPYSISGPQVSTLAGSSLGFADGPGDQAKFHYPQGVVVDATGNVYVADMDNHRIRKITPDGEVSTFAGGEEGLQDGIGTAAKFRYPGDLVIDAFDNIYVADMNNHCIRKISPSGEVVTVAGSGSPGTSDGTGTSATFNTPVRLTISPEGNLFVVGYLGHKVRKVTPEGVVTTIAGSTPGYADGTGSEAKFDGPHGIAIDAAGDLIVAEYNNHRIRRVTQAGVVTTIAGSSEGYEDGNGISAKFNSPAGVAIDLNGNILVCDVKNHKIRMITPEGVVSTLVGTIEGYEDGPKEDAKFNSPFGIAVHTDGSIFIGDRNNNKIRKIIINP